MDASEAIASGEIVSMGWQVETLVPLCTGRLLCLGKHRYSLDQRHLETFWTRYKSVRASRVWTRCSRNMRIAVAFTSSTGAEHWIATGPGAGESPGTEYMETEDHVCHPLDGTLFREIVNLIGERDDVLQDQQYGKYL